MLVSPLAQAHLVVCDFLLIECVSLSYSNDTKKFYASLVDKIKGESFKSSSVDLSLLDLGPLKELEKKGFVGVKEYDMDSSNILKKQIQVAPRLEFMNDIIKDFFNPFGISFEPYKSYRASISFGVKRIKKG
jgi:hypothetical protein